MSDTDSYVGNTMPINEFREYVRSTRKKVPTIRWIGESYHHAKERIQWVGGRMVSQGAAILQHSILLQCITSTFRKLTINLVSISLGGALDIRKAIYV